MTPEEKADKAMWRLYWWIHGPLFLFAAVGYAYMIYDMIRMALK